MRTTLAVEHANCPECFNETLDYLRQVPGIRAVAGSMAGSCIEVDHDGVAPAVISAAVRDRLHTVEMFSNEVRMVPVEPVALNSACARHAGGASPTTRGGAQ